MARFDGGWVRIQRRCIFGDIGQRSNDCLGLWVRMIGMACLRETRILWKGAPRDLLPGQILTGLSDLANSDKASDISKVRRDLTFLEKRQSIQQEIGNQGRIITILNWGGIYQSILRADNQETEVPTNERQTGDKRTTNETQLIEELKKERSKELEKEEIATAIVSDTGTPREAIKPEGQSAGALTWRAYKKAYQEKYGEPPSWNAKVAGQLRTFVSRIPSAEAPVVAEFYLTHTNRLYVESMHPVGLLLRDAEKLRTEWATGRKMTSAKARHSESADFAHDQLRRIQEGSL